MNDVAATPIRQERRPIGLRILLALLAGIACGLFFGEWCAVLDLPGKAYVGLLQMTVLPYLVCALTSKLGRLDAVHARRLGGTAAVVLLLLWSIGISVVVVVSGILPTIQGASFFSPGHEHGAAESLNVLDSFVPANIFHALSAGLVPAVVVFCLCFGTALIAMPNKERLLEWFELCGDGIGRINHFLVQLSPLGLFLLTAPAAGTLRMEELAKLQGYLIILTIAVVLTGFVILPSLVCSLTGIRCRDFLRAAQEPLLTVIATGKLFVVLPQIADQCDRLLSQYAEQNGDSEHATGSVMVPLAYPFPHLGKILTFVFVSFAAWYTGQELSTTQTATMATTGTITSFASPLVSIPFLLDQYELAQDLMTLFLLPGFITMRLGDVVGVLHLMALSVIVHCAIRKRVNLRVRAFAFGLAGTAISIALCAMVARQYLASTSVEYDLHTRFQALEIRDPHGAVTVLQGAPNPAEPRSSNTLDRIRNTRQLRVGYPPDHLPYAFFNSKQQLVGLDVELMHSLASRLDVELVFMRFHLSDLRDHLERGDFDMAIGGLLVKPSRLLEAGYTQPYQTATVAIAIPDYRRKEFRTWEAARRTKQVRLGVSHSDLALPARRILPNVEFVVVGAIRDYFEGLRPDLDGLLLAGEEGAVWNVLYPDHAVVVPEPRIQRPLGFAVRSEDSQWLEFLNRWLDFEDLNGSTQELRAFWVEGGGTETRPPRWCILRDVLHWID